MTSSYHPKGLFGGGNERSSRLSNNSNGLDSPAANGGAITSLPNSSSSLTSAGAGGFRSSGLQMQAHGHLSGLPPQDRSGSSSSVFNRGYTYSGSSVLARANMLDVAARPPLLGGDTRTSSANSARMSSSKSVPPGSRANNSGSCQIPSSLGALHGGGGGPFERGSLPRPELDGGAASGAAGSRHEPSSSLRDVAARDVMPSRTSDNPRSRSTAPNAAASRGAEVGSRCNSGATCDKCDGKHRTDQCPYFRGDREKHRDAWVNYGCKGNPHQMGASGGNFVLRQARVIRQPGDGNCLFHSLSHGLQPGTSAQALRREIATFLKQNPALQIAGDTLEEWVRWDSNSSVSSYARRMAVSGWGGGIEMACCSLLKKVNVHVYEGMGIGCNSDFKRISCFDSPNAAKTVHVLYQGGVHYDALQPIIS